MKKVFFSCVAVATLMVFLSASSVFAEGEATKGNTGFYIGISGGYVIPQTLTISDPDSSFKYTDATLKNGYLAGVTAGWLTPFTRRIMALEMEYNYIFGTDFDNGKIISVNLPQDLVGHGTFDGTIRIHALLFNAKARYPEGRFHPYAGFGLGYAYSQVGDITVRGPGGSVIIPSESGGAFCWQLMTGLDFDITPNFSVGVGYKYFATKPTIGDKDSEERIYVATDYKASIVTVGLAYTF